MSFPGLGIVGLLEEVDGGPQLLQLHVQLILTKLKLLTRHTADTGRLRPGVYIIPNPRYGMGGKDQD